MNIIVIINIFQFTNISIVYYEDLETFYVLYHEKISNFGELILSIISTLSRFNLSDFNNDVKDDYELVIVKVNLMYIKTFNVFLTIIACQRVT